MRHTGIFILALMVCLSVAVSGQQTNPVDRRVANPITDTPNINPVETGIKPTVPSKKPSFEAEGGNGEVVVYSDRQTVEGESGKRVVTHEGNVDVHFGVYRLQADKITIYEAENKMVAEGSVILTRATTSGSRVRKASGTTRRSSGTLRTRPVSQIRQTTAQ